MKKPKVKVVQSLDDQDNVPLEIIAQSIKAISDSVKKMRQLSLNNKAIILLLHDSSKVSKTQIHNVLMAMENLEDEYLKKPEIK